MTDHAARIYMTDCTPIELQIYSAVYAQHWLANTEGRRDPDDRVLQARCMASTAVAEYRTYQARLDS
jgi:cation transport regulator ChaB